MMDRARGAGKAECARQLEVSGGASVEPGRIQLTLQQLLTYVQLQFICFRYCWS